MMVWLSGINTNYHILFYYQCQRERYRFSPNLRIGSEVSSEISFIELVVSHSWYGKSDNKYTNYLYLDNSLYLVKLDS
jgi:hypothetical protein